MYEVYHAKFETDAEAVAFMKSFAVPAGAELHHSKAFGHDNAVLVLTCPKGTKLDKKVWELIFSFGPKSPLEVLDELTKEEEKTDAEDK